MFPSKQETFIAPESVKVVPYPEVGPCGKVASTANQVASEISAALPVKSVET